jgi:hypothetical protein
VQTTWPTMLVRIAIVLTAVAAVLLVIGLVLRADGAGLQVLAAAVLGAAVVIGIVGVVSSWIRPRSRDGRR